MNYIIKTVMVVAFPGHPKTPALNTWRHLYLLASVGLRLSGPGCTLSISCFCDALGTTSIWAAEWLMWSKEACTCQLLPRHPMPQFPHLYTGGDRQQPLFL